MISAAITRYNDARPWAISVVSVEWSPAHQRDVAIVTVDGATYRLPLAEDPHAPTGCGGGSGPAWSVDDTMTRDEDDEAIGSRYDDIGEAVVCYMRGDS